MDEFKYVKYEVAEHVGTITLDRPDKANAQNERLLDELDARFTTAEYDDGVKVIVLRGEGKHFSSGHDIAGDEEDEGAQLAEDNGRFEQHKMYRWESRKYFGYSWKWRNIPKPTIAAVNGHASGAGAFLALACDYRIMRSDRGWFCLPEVDFGVPIDPRMMDLLKARVSPQVARDAVLSGRRYGGEDALAAGFADALASEGDLLIDAKKRADELATKERGIFGTLKRTLYADLAASFGIAG